MCVLGCPWRRPPFQRLRRTSLSVLSRNKDRIGGDKCEIVARSRPAGDPSPLVIVQEGGNNVLAPNLLETFSGDGATQQDAEMS